jgi:hypothetical protein
MKKLITILILIITSNINGATFFVDTLSSNYIDGNLVGQNGWNQTSTTATNPIQYATDKVVVGPTGQDVWKSFQTQAVKANVSTLYTRIDFSVVNAQTTGDYFFSLSDPAGTSSNFYQRLFVRASGSGFNLGLMSTSGTGSLTVWGNSVLDLNTLYSAVIAWDMVFGPLNDTFSLYLNPNSNDRSLLVSEIQSNWTTTTGSEPLINISALNLRQGSATTASTVYVEELYVADTLTDIGLIPEPSIFQMVGIGLISLLAYHRVNKRNG